MSEPPPLEEWYGHGSYSFAQRQAQGALLAGARHLKRGEYFVAYTSWQRAEAAAGGSEARRIRGVVHLAAAGVKHRDGDARGARRQLVRAQARLQEGPPELLNVDIDALVLLIEQLVMPHSGASASGDSSSVPGG
jgi:predicted metal-dependent hydrolase